MTRNERTRRQGDQPAEQDDDAADAGTTGAGATSDPIRGPLPPGSAREDYVGGDKPHKTRERETKTGTRERAGRKRNEVV